jgi:hypothetical protein
VIAVPGILITVLDEKPIGPFAAQPITRRSHEHSTAMQALTLQDELSIAFGERLFRGVLALRCPVTAIPHSWTVPPPY